MNKKYLLLLLPLLFFSCIESQLLIDPLDVWISEYNPEKAGVEVVSSFDLDEANDSCCYNSKLYTIYGNSKYIKISIYDITNDFVNLEKEKSFNLNSYIQNSDSLTVQCIIPRKNNIFFLITADGINQLYYTDVDLKSIQKYEYEIDNIFATQTFMMIDYLPKQNTLSIYNVINNRIFLRTYIFDEFTDKIYFKEEVKKSDVYRKNDVFSWNNRTVISDVSYSESTNYILNFLNIEYNDNPDIKKAICLSYLCITNSPIYVFATDDDYIWIHYVKRNDDTHEYEYKLLKLKLLE